MLLTKNIEVDGNITKFKQELEIVGKKMMVILEVKYTTLYTHMTMKQRNDIH
jgi:hypothetical protein